MYGMAACLQAWHGTLYVTMPRLLALNAQGGMQGWYEQTHAHMTESGRWLI